MKRNNPHAIEKIPADEKYRPDDQYAYAQSFAKSTKIEYQKLATSFYEKAASSGHIRAQCYCGSREEAAGNHEKALKWYRRAARQKDILGQYNFARMCELTSKDKDIKNRRALARKYYQKAAAAGHPGAQEKLHAREKKRKMPVAVISASAISLTSPPKKPRQETKSAEKTAVVEAPPPIPTPAPSSPAVASAGAPNINTKRDVPSPLHYSFYPNATSFSFESNSSPGVGEESKNKKGATA